MVSSSIGSGDITPLVVIDDIPDLETGRAEFQTSRSDRNAGHSVCNRDEKEENTKAKARGAQSHLEPNGQNAC